MGQTEIIWHADPTVAARAVSGRYDAEAWDAAAGDPAGWAVFVIGAETPEAQGTAPTLDQAKAEAEQFIRAHA